MTITLDINDSDAAFFLNLIRKFDFVRINQPEKTTPLHTEKKIMVVEVDATGYRFDREELNERL